MNLSTSSLFSQLLSLVDRSRFARLVRDTGSERRSKGFASWDHFVAMLFCQLAQARSLREIDAGLSSCEGKLKHLGMAGAPGRSTLSYANSKRPAVDGVGSHEITCPVPGVGSRIVTSTILRPRPPTHPFSSAYACACAQGQASPIHILSSQKSSRMVRTEDIGNKVTGNIGYTTDWAHALEGSVTNGTEDRCGKLRCFSGPDLP